MNFTEHCLLNVIDDFVYNLEDEGVPYQEIISAFKEYTEVSKELYGE